MYYISFLVVFVIGLCHLPSLKFRDVCLLIFICRLTHEKVFEDLHGSKNEV